MATFATAQLTASETPSLPTMTATDAQSVTTAQLVPNISVNVHKGHIKTNVARPTVKCAKKTTTVPQQQLKIQFDARLDISAPTKTPTFNRSKQINKQCWIRCLIEIEGREIFKIFPVRLGLLVQMVM